MPSSVLYDHFCTGIKSEFIISDYTILSFIDYCVTFEHSDSSQHNTNKVQYQYLNCFSNTVFEINDNVILFTVQERKTVPEDHPYL